jgi:hypothetical protein
MASRNIRAYFVKPAVRLLEAHMRFRYIVWSLFVLTVPALSAAQIKIGGARLTGLAGAGLALPYDSGAVVHNPAIFARKRHAARLRGPNLDYYTRGLSFGAFQDIYGSLEDGALETENFGTLARRFAENRKEIGVSGSIGATLGGLYIGYRAEGSASTIPNQELEDWADQSGDPATLSTTYAGAGLEGFGYAFESVEFGYGVPVQQPSGTWNVGAKVKNVRAFYTHVIANAATIQSGGEGAPGPEMGGDDVLQGTGVGADLGFQYTPQTTKNFHFGGVIENIVRPSVGFDQAAPETGDLKHFNPFNTALSLGVAYVPDEKFMAAADYIDITNSANRSGLRVGAEYRFRKHLAVSAGVNTRDTWIIGADIGGVFVTFSGRNKLWLGQGLKF